MGTEPMPLEQIASRKGALALFSKKIRGRVAEHEPIAISGLERQVAPCQLDDRNERLKKWFEDWRPAMRRWLSSRSKIQAADLDDVAQEVFLRLLRYSNDAMVEHPQSYLFRIAANVVNEWHERARNKLPHAEDGLEELQIEAHHEPEYSAERTLIESQVRSAVTRLPSRQRLVLLAHINEDLTYKQVAAKYRLTPRVVRRDIAHAYATLRLELMDEHTGALPILRLPAPESNPVDKDIR